MSYIGDFNPSDVFDTKFCTVTSSGAPDTFTTSPAVVIYKDSSTVSTTLGITLTTNFAGVTGLNNLHVDTSASAGFYASGHNFMAVVSAGQAGGVTISGYVVAEFSIWARSALRPTTASRTLNVSAGGLADSNAVQINGITTSNVTTVNANIGTTQAITFDANNLQKVDVEDWKGTTVSTAATAGIPDVNVKNINNVAAATPGAAGGILIAGSNAATTFASAVFTGTVTMSDGLAMSRTTLNTSALIVTGNGTGHGAIFTSGNGASGDGVQMVAASTNGNGLKAVGTGTLNGIFCQGGDGTNGDGLHCVAGAGTSMGIRGIGGGTAGSGIYGIGTAGNAAGIQGIGEGTGDGLSVSSLGGGNPISAAAANQFADGLLARNVAGGSSAGRIVSEALYPLRNLWTVNTTSGVYTVYKVDDLTIAWTAALTTNGSAQPITGSDPST